MSGNKDVKVRVEPTPEEETADDVFVDIYNLVYKEIDSLVTRGTLDFSNLDELYKIAMETVEFISQSKTMSGTRKSEIAKQVIIRVLEDLRDKGKIPEDVADPIIASVDMFAGTVFKMIIAVSKGKWNVQNTAGGDPQPGCCGCCTII